MKVMARLRNPSALLAVAVIAALGAAEAAPAASGGTSPGSKPPVVKKKPAPKKKKPPKVTFPISKPTWLTGFLTTEYWPAPEKWFNGAKVMAPGLTTAHRVDFLYSARGVAMEGDGIDLNGRHVHYVSGSSGWVDQSGRRGGYYWLAEMFWRNSAGDITYPLEGGGWSNGACKGDKKHPKVCRKVGAKETRFATGASLGASGLPLRPYKSVAVDPRVIRYRSAVYVPAYDNGRVDGWFCAADTGGAIVGRHLDVYRPAPAQPASGYSLKGQRIRVLPPGDAHIVYPFLCR
jgi:3D (Asp-Asp-Asp) domain-containing protein